MTVESIDWDDDDPSDLESQAEPLRVRLAQRLAALLLVVL